MKTYPEMIFPFTSLSHPVQSELQQGLKVRLHFSFVSSFCNMAEHHSKLTLFLCLLPAPIIVVLAASGGTSQLIAKYRPEAAVVVGVVPSAKRDQLEFKGGIDSAKIVRHSFASRGLYPMVCKPADSTDDLITETMNWAKERGLCGGGDKAVAVHRQLKTGVLVMKILEVPK